MWRHARLSIEDRELVSSPETLVIVILFGMDLYCTFNAYPIGHSHPLRMESVFRVVRRDCTLES